MHDTKATVREWGDVYFHPDDGRFFHVEKAKAMISSFAGIIIVVSHLHNINRIERAFLWESRTKGKVQGKLRHGVSV